MAFASNIEILTPYEEIKLATIVEDEEILYEEVLEIS